MQRTQTRSSFAMPLYPTTLPGHPRLHHQFTRRRGNARPHAGHACGVGALRISHAPPAMCRTPSPSSSRTARTGAALRTNPYASPRNASLARRVPSDRCRAAWPRAPACHLHLQVAISPRICSRPSPRPFLSLPAGAPPRRNGVTSPHERGAAADRPRGGEVRARRRCAPPLRSPGAPATPTCYYAAALRGGLTRRRARPPRPPPCPSTCRSP